MFNPENSHRLLFTCLNYRVSFKYQTTLYLYQELATGTNAGSTFKQVIILNDL